MQSVWELFACVIVCRSSQSHKLVISDCVPTQIQIFRCQIALIKLLSRYFCTTNCTFRNKNKMLTKSVSWHGASGESRGREAKYLIKDVRFLVLWMDFLRMRKLFDPILCGPIFKYVTTKSDTRALHILSLIWASLPFRNSIKQSFLCFVYVIKRSLNVGCEFYFVVIFYERFKNVQSDECIYLYFIYRHWIWVN